MIVRFIFYKSIEDGGRVVSDIMEVGDLKPNSRGGFPKFINERLFQALNDGEEITILRIPK